MLIRHRTESQRWLVRLFSWLGVLFYLDAECVEHSYSTLAGFLATIAARIVLLVVIPMVVYYLSILFLRHRPRRLMMLLFIPAVAYCGVILVSESMGMRDFFRPLVAYTYRICLMIELGWCVYFIFNILHRTHFQWSRVTFYLFGEGQVPSAQLMAFLFAHLMALCLLRVIFGLPFLIEHVWMLYLMALALSAIEFFIGQLGMVADVQVSSRRIFSRYSTGVSSMVNRHGEDADDIADSDADEVAVTPALTPIVVPLSPGEADVLRRFDKAVAEKQFYLNPSLRIEDVCQTIRTNRTTLARAVEVGHGQYFRDYMNKLRIEHAKQYLIEHPDSGQEEVAMVSGFVSASTFCRKFKQMEGVSPYQWLVAKSKTTNL